MNQINNALILALSLLSFNSAADGLNGKDPLATNSMTPDQSDKYQCFGAGDFCLKSLNVIKFPDGTWMLPNDSVNYYRSYNKWPCYYDVGIEKTPCLNPSDMVINFHSEKNNRNKDYVDVPEPNVKSLISSAVIMWFAFMINVRRRYRWKI